MSTMDRTPDAREADAAGQGIELHGVQWTPVSPKLIPARFISAIINTVIWTALFSVPLVLHLLSPAQRPIQITRDLPGFWRGSWAAVRSDMRGQYPKHPWPEDPLNAEPTRRAKPRGT